MSTWSDWNLKMNPKPDPNPKKNPSNSSLFQERQNNTHRPELENSSWRQPKTRFEFKKIYRTVSRIIERQSNFIRQAPNITWKFWWKYILNPIRIPSTKKNLSICNPMCTEENNFRRKATDKSENLIWLQPLWNFTLKLDFLSFSSLPTF